MKKRITLITGLSIMLVALLATVAFARPQFAQWTAGAGSSTIAIMNIDPAAQPANYVIDFYGQDGTTDGQLAGTSTLPYRGEVRYDVATASLPFGTGWVGSAVISSDRQVTAAVNQRYQNPAYSSGDGWNGGAYSSPIPATEIYMPYLTQYDANAFNDGRWCRLTVQNTGSDAATVYVNIYKEDGSWDTTWTEVIDPSRSYTWEPNFSSPEGNRSAYITSTNPIVAVFDGFWTLGKTSGSTGWSTSYESIPAANADYTLVYADVFRVHVGFSETQPWVQWSNVLVQNTSLVATANITVSWYATGESTPRLVFNDTLAPNSPAQYNTRYMTPPGGGSYTSLGAGFYGSTIIESDQPIVGVSHSFWDYAPFKAGATYNAASPNEGASVVYTPFVSRQVSGSTWSAWNKINVTNVDPVNPAVVSVYFYQANGTVISFPQITNITIAPGGADGFNTRYGTTSGNGTAAQYATALGNSYSGGVMITATGGQIVATNNLIYTNRINTINGVPEP